jgi:tRNA(fMet)-specific endonuclease VapC
MVRRIALDTNIAIDLLNGNTATLTSIKKYDVVYLPVTVCGELLFGAKNSFLNKKNEKRYKQFIETCEILDNNLLVASTYAAIRLELKKKGRPIPENDIWIAATCKVNKIPLLTRDQHFSHVPKLRVLNPK